MTCLDRNNVDLASESKKNIPALSDIIASVILVFYYYKTRLYIVQGPFRVYTVFGSMGLCCSGFENILYFGNIRRLDQTCSAMREFLFSIQILEVLRRHLSSETLLLQWGATTPIASGRLTDFGRTKRNGSLKANGKYSAEASLLFPLPK